MYTCRHTFAKRILSGYWTGQPATIETLAGLMGNTPSVCWKHSASCAMNTHSHCGMLLEEAIETPDNRVIQAG